MRRTCLVLAAVGILAACARGPDLRRLPRLDLPPPRLLESLHPGVAFSGFLGSGCAAEEGYTRLLAVMVDHDPRARPQSGLASACLVYEIPIEARFPRLMAVFADAGPERVGPVRSVRPAFLQVAAELGAVVAHAGASEPAYRYIRTGPVPVLNEFSIPWPYWRDRSRRMPHNLYASLPRLREAVRRLGWDRQPATRVPPERLEYRLPEGHAAAEVALPYPPGFEVRFVYRDGAYERWVAGRLQLDDSGRPLRVRTVVVQYARWRGWRAGRVDVSEVGMVGSGEGFVLTGGVVVPVRWHKSSDLAPTAFTDLQGRGLILPGPVWVSVVPEGRPVAVR
ncbi:MAG: DUF3048 domain-containing protein [Armatimonadota bacterium]|nr:DUF3048 domain-containing protein [Armatimonadota bacterium]MDR7393756.1 DUF3048 domain-containing protein [Armatimonadota bacterium]MDR7395937.1 DUF3048 domain-containing protein [Armatimonadota bacterium]MDR7398743.1 DUF3048 domain-containing protein [Armatimonadota bacterium]MDR7407083.1 DUF3048 domain-containing protein [Armatimonadota bacterium]